jgi:hypothetical protein
VRRNPQSCGEEGVNLAGVQVRSSIYSTVDAVESCEADPTVLPHTETETWNVPMHLNDLRRDLSSDDMPSRSEERRVFVSGRRALWTIWYWRLCLKLIRMMPLRTSEWEARSLCLQRCSFGRLFNVVVPISRL